ncbi:MAG: hypothetical protein DDT23_00332 [candidate division WS2 bacterium]|nr:hypothetical protein [Candidatus Lithacetigena glycinireducens]
MSFFEKLVERVKNFFNLNPQMDSKKRGLELRVKAKPKVTKFPFKFKRDTSFESHTFKYSFDTIAMACGKDSLLNRAINVYIELFLKEGWFISSDNEESSAYINKRISLFTETTGKPFKILLEEMALDLIMFHNVFLLKGRSDIVGLRIKKKITGVNNKKPIAGYFRINPEYVSMQRDVSGRVIKYEVRIPGEDPQYFDAEDIIHMYCRRETGALFGTSFLLSVLDDIEALREMESSVIKLIQRNLFPFIKYKVGLPQPGLEASEEELTNVRKSIEENPVDAVVVMPERHDIDVIGSQGVALNINDYINHFLQRIMFSLGFSGSRATEISIKTATSDLFDRVRSYQTLLSIFINEFIIRELLLEVGIDVINDSKKSVFFKFNEIDIDLQIKKEVHSIYKYEHNITSEDETRIALGYNILGDKEERMHLHRVKIPTMLTRYSVGTKDDTKETDNLLVPQNQHSSVPSGEVLMDIIRKVLLEKRVFEVLDEKLEVFGFSIESRKEAMAYLNSYFCEIEGISDSNRVKAIGEFYVRRLVSALGREGGIN